MKKLIITFVVSQSIGLVVLYFLQNYIFGRFEEIYAWLIFGFFVIFYLANFVYVLIDVVSRVKKIKAFHW